MISIFGRLPTEPISQKNKWRVHDYATSRGTVSLIPLRPTKINPSIYFPCALLSLTSFFNWKCFYRRTRSDLQSCGQWAHEGMCEKTARSRGRQSRYGHTIKSKSNSDAMEIWKRDLLSLTLFFSVRHGWGQKKMLNISSGLSPVSRFACA